MSILVLLAVLLAVGGCDQETLLAPIQNPATTTTLEIPAGQPGPAQKGLGDVEIVWRGQNAPDPMMPDPTPRRAFAEFDLHQATADRPTHGSFAYRVVSTEGEVHREVVVAVDGVAVDPEEHRLWFTGTVISDTKGCDGGPDGGHDSGCSDEGSDEEGCGGHDGGCGEDGHDSPDGGCTDSHDTADTTCSGDDGSHGGVGGGHGASGRYCRVGQRLVGKMHDGGSPGAAYDGITWKWFLADDPALPTIDDLSSWPHLCRKEILGGNLTVFVPRPRGPVIQATG